MPDETGRTDGSDVLITAFSKWYVWAVIALAVIVMSGWASPQNVTDFFDHVFRAWRCQP